MTPAPTLKAIETVYAGYRFRSRLEARWAVFFDTLGIAWEYEKEGYDLGEAGWYLPDFWLPDAFQWVEIKAQEPSDIEREKCRQLVLQQDNPTCTAVIAYGELAINKARFDVFANNSDAVNGILTLNGCIRVTTEKTAYTTSPYDEWKEHAFVSFFGARGERTQINEANPGEFSRRFTVARYATWTCFGLGFCYNGSAHLIDIIKDLDKAFTAARQARFEHGETPRRGQ